MMPPWMRVVIYPLFAIFSFIIFVMIQFPSTAVKLRVERELQTRLGREYAVTIHDVSFMPMAALSLENISIYKRDAPKRPLVAIDDASIDISLVPLLWGTVNAELEIESAGGEIDGEVSYSESKLSVEADIDELDLGKFPILADKYGFKLSTQLNGDVDVTIYPQATMRSSGSLNLILKEIKLQDSTIMGFPVPAMDMALPAGKSRVDLVMNKGNIELRSFNLKGGNLDLSIGGKVYMAQKFENYRFNLRGKLTIDEVLNEKLDIALKMVKKYRAADGSFPLAMTGQMRRPNLRVNNVRVPI